MELITISPIVLIMTGFLGFMLGVGFAMMIFYRQINKEIGCLEETKEEYRRLFRQQDISSSCGYKVVPDNLWTTMN